METLLDTPVFTANLDPRGFVECIVKDAQELRRSDIAEVGAILEQRDMLPARVLVDRRHEYSTDTTILTSAYSANPIRVERVAFLTYTPLTEHVAKLVGDIVLRQCPHEIFLDRDVAIAWLLEGK